MMSAHQQNYLLDAVCFVLSVLPVAILVLFVLLSRLEHHRRSVRRDRVRADSREAALMLENLPPRKAA